VEQFQCAAGAGPGTCTPIASCADAGKRCGEIGDGCGGTIDCTAELGECEKGTYCSAKTPYQCDAPDVNCTPAASCEELGWECGAAVDDCGTIHDCAAEDRRCGALEQCVGSPTTCEVPSGWGPCELCPAVPSCQTGVTRLTGRVITPGRDDANTANQLGVPNAFVYIVRNNDLDDLPPLSTGIPASGTSCDRCDEQDLGPILASATTNAEGEWEIAGNVPVGAEFLLVTKVGKFRRATRVTVPNSGACQTTDLPIEIANNPTRLPRSTSDGLAVNIPKIAVTTGQLDAMECVFEKMGIAHSEFSAAGSAAPRVHLYRGGEGSTNSGATIAGITKDSALYGNLATLEAYDIVVADCEGPDWDADFSERTANGDKLRNYVNRGGRLFASHLSFSWLHQNGADSEYPTGAADYSTSFRRAATWRTSAVTGLNTGTGIISLNRPNSSPRIENFRDWMVREMVTTAPAYQFTINEPRSQVNGLGTHSEEFVHCSGGQCTGEYVRTQQFSFNAPYAADADEACGRVAYSGFHVSIGNANSQTFPNHCGGDLTSQEKVLLYMLFDLGACVGETPEPPQCNPISCEAGRCGVIPNGCGGTVDCGSCIPPCNPTTCEEQDAECGNIGDGCNKVIDCGDCPPGQTCGAIEPNKCGEGPECTPKSCEDVDAECGLVGDGCGDINNCGECPPGQICGLEEPYKCGTPQCTPIDCDEANAECGEISDGCGEVIDCGDCSSGQVCGVPWANRCSGIPE
jgi:hypothetical protein